MGATGHFGGLIALELAESNLPGALSVTSRDLRRAGRLAANLDQLSAKTAVKSCGLDVTDRGDCRSVLPEHDLCIDAAGPFYSRSTELVEDCIKCGCDYLDLSSDPGYSGKVAELAAESDIRVFPSHSTYSATTLLLLKELRESLEEVDSVRTGLIMATRGGAGRAAMRTLLHGLSGAEVDRGELNFPEPLGRKRIQRYATTDDLWMQRAGGVTENFSGIGFTSPVAQRVVELGVHLGIMGESLTGLFAAGQQVLEFFPGSRTTGCLRLEADGQKGSTAINLLSESAGPLVPTIPAVLTGRRYLQNEPPGLEPGLCWLHEWLDYDYFERACRERGSELITDSE